MKISHDKTLLLGFMCLGIHGCSKPEPVKESTDPVLTVTPVEGESFSIPDLNLEMLWCQTVIFMLGSPEDEKGSPEDETQQMVTFTMGSPVEEKGHRKNETQYEVILTKGFWLGQYEVTQEQWEKVMGANPSHFRGATRPVESVSWDDAMKFCEKLTEIEKAAGRLPEGCVYTLPTEAQWEYACRAGTIMATAYGGSLSSKQANFNGEWPYGGAMNGPDLESTTEVGSYPTNWWGFHDMHGNVAEWCSNWYGSYPFHPYRPAIDPIGPSDGSERVIRGGNWDFHGRNLRSAARSRATPDYRTDTLGFRLSLQSNAPTNAPTKAPTNAPSKAPTKAPAEPVLTAGPFEGESFSIPDINLVMLWCKPGTFMRGSPNGEAGRYDDETHHEVTLTKGFYLGKYEVTQEQWEKVMGSNPSNFKGATLPVEKVFWDDTMEFCKKLTQNEKKAGRLPEGSTYTLPTEAQWEYACRAGTTTAYSFGDEITPKQANFSRNVDQTTAVGIYPANAWGFHDLHGNVWEWCSDWYGSDLYAYDRSGKVSDPLGAPPGPGRVFRGGSWSNVGRSLRSANRNKGERNYRIKYLGFRLSLQTEKKE